MVGFIQACLGHSNRAVAGSNPALPTTQFFVNSTLTEEMQPRTQIERLAKPCDETATDYDAMIYLHTTSLGSL